MECAVWSHYAPVIARRKRSEGRGNPLHAMGASGLCGSVFVTQWIATGFQPSRWQEYEEMKYAVRSQHAVCHCEKDDSLTRQSIVSRGRFQTCLFAYGFTVDRHGLSALAMTKNIIQRTSMQSTALHLSLQKEQKETSRVAICSQKIFSFSSIFIP